MIPNVCDVDEYLGLGKSPRTAYLYARTMQRVVPLLAAAGTDLASCRAPDVARLAEHWPRTHASQGLLRAALQAAWELLGRESWPTRAVRVPPRPDMICRALGDASVRRLEAAAWARRDRRGLAVLAGLYGALRRSEIARLHVGDFRDQDDGRWLRVAGKGERSSWVPVHPVLARAVERTGPHRGWLFPGRFGGPVHAATIWEWTRQVAADAGLGPVATHALRHTSLTEMNDRSGDLRAVQSIARHSRPETTAGYTRTRAARMREVVEMVDYGRQPEPA